MPGPASVGPQRVQAAAEMVSASKLSLRFGLDVQCCTALHCQTMIGSDYQQHGISAAPQLKCKQQQYTKHLLL